MRRMYSLKQLKEVASVQAKIVKKDISTLVDKDGHNRFIEGDITMETVEGATQSYGKWALSGSHLLIVLCYSVLDTTAMPYISILAEINVPDWIKEKIIPLGSDYIETKSVSFYADDNSMQTTNVILRKNELADRLFLSQTGLTLTKNRNCRIAFDLLIDNE